MMTSNRPRMAVRAVLAAVGIFATLAAITHPWKALSQSAQPVIPLLNGTPGGTVANPFNIAGSFSASISGFAFNGSYVALTATASSSGSTALPTGTDVIFQNTSSVAVSCVISTGAATATTNKIIINGNSWIQVTVGSNVNTACINQTGSASNVVALAGGAGIATGAGGGGGSGGAVTIASGGVASGAYASGSIASGAVASGAIASGAYASGSIGSGAVASGAYASGALASGSVASGAMVDLGVIGDAASSAGGTGTVNAKLRLMTSQLDSINTNIQAGAGATGSAPPASAIYVAGNASGATGGLLKGVITCDLHAFYTGTDTGSKTLVAGVSGRKTYICGFALTTGTSATVLTLFKGTDADCATSGAAIGPPIALLANDKYGVMSSFWNGFVTATNADYVCINAGAGNQHTAEIWYAVL